MEPDWAMLPDDILVKIALRLDSVEEIIYFSLVCHSWNSVYDVVKRQWTKPCKWTVPWLVLPESKNDDHNNVRKLYCPSKKKSYPLTLPETYGENCWGSACGWIFTINDELECHLFNPLSRIRIPLPSQSTMPIKPSTNSPDRPVWYIKEYFVLKVLTFYIDESRDFIIIAICDNKRGYLTYTRTHDKVWAPIKSRIPSLKKKGNMITSCRVPAIDAIRWGSQILILYHNGAIGSCDISAFQNSQPINVSVFAPPPPLEILDVLREIRLYGLYLVESDGDLLIVLRYKQHCYLEQFTYKTICFQVYKLNFDTKTWDILKDLGSVALFVGGSCSMSVKPSDSNKCKHNCIYFTDDESFNLSVVEGGGGHDMGCFFMANKKIEKVYEGDDIHSLFCAAFWLMPKF